jgi:hypothetical protein
MKANLKQFPENAWFALSVKSFFIRVHPRKSAANFYSVAFARWKVIG